MEDISNKTLALLLGVAIVVSLVGIFTAQNGMVSITGAANSGSGTVQYTGADITELVVTQNINFGVGEVNNETGAAVVDSDTGLTTDGTWSFASQAILIENLGTRNLSIDVESSATSAEFIGGSTGTGPAFKYKIQEVETGSCASTLVGAATSYILFGASQGDVKDEKFEVCASMYHGAENTLNLTAQLTIPHDAVFDNHVATVTITGTAV